MAINLHHPFHKATGTGLYLPPSRSRPLPSNAAAQSKPISWALAYPRPTVVSQQCDADAAKGVVQHDVVSLPTNRPVVSSWDIPRAEEQSMTVAAPKGKRKSASTQLQQLLAADSVSASLLLRNNELLSRAVNKNRSMPDAQNKSALPSTLEDSRRPLEKTVHVTPGQKESTLSTLKSSLDLSGFHSTQLTFGDDTVVPSNVSISSQESTDTSPNKTIAMYKTSQATTISPEHNSLTTAKPRTVIDFAAAAAAKRKETAPSPYKQQVVYLECPLDFLSRVCESATLQCPSTRDPQFHSTDEPNYPMNLVEDPSTTFLFTNKQQQPSSNTITRRRSKTDLLIQAMEEEHKPLEWTNDPQQRVSTSKRKSPNEDTICLDKLGDLIHKRHKVSNNTSTTPSIQSDPMALQAFLVADRALQDPKIWKQLLFSMTITRDWKQRVRGVSEPPPGIVLEKAFLWSVYPSLETVLIDNMREYYEMSMDKACTKEQLVFNNRLLSLVKETAAKKGWIWGEGYNTDKKIRNRVRCYYKSHIQNAKKRLYTILRNPSDSRHIKTLAEHFHIIKDQVGDIYEDSIAIFELKNMDSGTASTVKCTVNQSDGNQSCDTNESLEDQKMTNESTTTEQFVRGQPNRRETETTNTPKSNSDKSISPVLQHSCVEMNGQKTGLYLP